jgi:hypothetical protein
MGHENSIQSRLLATHCVACGRRLTDAVSVEMGIGPECRDGFNGSFSEEQRAAANKIVFKAAIAAQSGAAEEVIAAANALRDLGFTDLAEKVGRRFVNATKNAARDGIIIALADAGARLLVTTPYRRGDSDAYTAAWRAVPGRRWDHARKINIVPADARPAVWDLLRRFFPGKWATGPKGIFRIPAADGAA